jgi:hypothetical protein
MGRHKTSRRLQVLLIMQCIRQQNHSAILHTRHEQRFENREIQTWLKNTPHILM